MLLFNITIVYLIKNLKTMSTNKNLAAKAASKKGSVKPKNTAKTPVSKVVIPKSHAFVRTLVDSKTRILMSLSALPSDDKKVKTKPAAVFIHTLIGNTGYQETVEFEKMPRALEYVADFGQVQANRFALAAIAYNKQHDFELNPPLQMTAKDPNADTKKG